MPDWTFYSEHSAPKPYDIVWGAFPTVEDPNIPGPKPRPCLVRKFRVRSGNVWVEVAFGTSNTKRYGARMLYIANFQDMLECQLPQATLFNLDRTALLPWASEFFVPREAAASPIVGRLNRRSIDHLQAILRSS